MLPALRKLELVSGEAFPRMQNIRHRVSAERLQEHMDVIRHDDEAIEHIAFVMKMAKRAGHEFSG